MSSQNYVELKRKALKKFFNVLNPQQQDAVFNIDGPQLILAGAGTGKTSVIVNRIINMTLFGNAFNDETVQGSNEDIVAIERFIDGSCEDIDLLQQAIAVSIVRPRNIVAITFTNKAAKELKSRLAAALGENAFQIQASTFHLLCLKILRKNIHLIGRYGDNFVIYGSDDTQKLIKECIIELDISEKNFPPKTVATVVSSYKSRLMFPEDVIKENSDDFRAKTIGRIYALYQKKLMDFNAVDFDDIIMLTVNLLENHKDVLENCNRWYKYIMVDEYQDTNFAQFRLIQLLSAQNENICVVGDDNQSIYAFRGADITNILNFQKHFPNTKVVKLEQNYRSTQNILDASNSLITNNKYRMEKKLWTKSSKGDSISLYKATDEIDEAMYVADTIKKMVNIGMCTYHDCAILYRINTLSNVMGKAMVKESIPYRVYNGIKFYERKEIRDVIAYLSVINNEFDMLRLKRIINEPKRGIGDATLEVLEEIIGDLKVSPLQVMRDAGNYSLLSRKAISLKNIAKMFDYLKEKSQMMPLHEFFDLMLVKTNYGEYLANLDDEGKRIENVMEFKSEIIQYMNNNDHPTLEGFLEEISLYSDTDNLDDDDCVSIMTIHNAKGLEFENVFMVGMEENIFPHSKSVYDESELEEERRIAYVGITRAKRKLYLSYASQRTLYGETRNNCVSRFVEEIDSSLVCKKINVKKSGYPRVSKTHTAPQSFTLQQQIASKRIQERRVSTPQNVMFFEGDTVLHTMFGSGTVLSVTHTGGDYMLKVDFSKVGVKTIMTNYTKVKKINS